MHMKISCQLYSNIFHNKIVKIIRQFVHERMQEYCEKTKSTKKLLELVNSNLVISYLG